MPRVFRANSTVPVPSYKARTVDMTRNKDASCTVCIPFNADVELGSSDRICSIDALSLLAGSDTFNKFAAVFDEFKIQKYHCCIDLTRPSTSTARISVITTPLDWNGPWNHELAMRKPDGNVFRADQNNFWTELQTALVTLGVIRQNAAGEYVRNYTTNTRGNAYYLLEILFQLYKKQPIATKFQGMMSTLSNPDDDDEDGDDSEMSTDDEDDDNVYAYMDDQGNNHFMTLELDDNENPYGLIYVPQNGLPNYQIIGAAALRQIPRGFYAGVRLPNQTQRPEYADYYRWNDWGANDIAEYNLTDEEIESIGNYIHDSYMPGSTVHLSLEVAGTSATEKSMYMPTSVIGNISQVDSFNQMGRFLPVGFLQNKVKVVDRREILSNGVFYEVHVEDVYQHLKNNNYDCDTIKKSLAVAINFGGEAYIFDIPFYTAPLKYTINNGILVLPDGPFVAIGFEGKDGSHFDPQNRNMTYAQFEQFVYDDTNGGSVVYNTAGINDARESNNGSKFSLQCYITVRLRNVRNILSRVAITYPYIIVDLDEEGLRLKDRNGDLQQTYEGKSKALVKATVGVNKSDPQTFLATMDYNATSLKILREIKLNNTVKGFVCHRFITYADNEPFNVLDDTDNERDTKLYVLYGMAVQINPEYPQTLFYYNYLSIPDRHTLQQWLGVARQPGANPGPVYHMIWVCSHRPTTTVGAVNTAFDTDPVVPANGLLDSDDWGKVQWLFVLSRMRSYGLVDGAVGNSCIELNCSPSYLNVQANVKPDFAGATTPNFSFYNLGVRVGTFINPVMNQLI